MFKFLHAADIHLDSSLKGLERYDGAPVEQIRNATRRALENLVALAIEEKVAFVLIAGDLYDGDWPDYNTGLYFIKQILRLKEAGIPLFLIAGNHDAANHMTLSLSLPDNATLFRHQSPDTVLLQKIGVAIHGQSFGQRAITEDLSQGYPAAQSGMFNIGLLHTSATGREGHESYAPCTAAGLRTKGYDYWALGHVHKREILCEYPHIVFPGNTQGRHIRERGAKGCHLVTVKDDQAVQVDFRSLDVFRWERANIDISIAETGDEILNQIAEQLGVLHRAAEGRSLAVRIELTGVSPVHRPLMAEKSRWINEIRAQAIGASDGEIWVEKIKFRTMAPSQYPPQETLLDGPVGELMALFQEVRADSSLLEALGVDFSDLTRRLPPELKQVVSVNDPERLLSFLAEAEAKLARQLFGQGQ